MLYLVMGVTGCGKSTIGKLLAARLKADFKDADEFHSEVNKAKMSRNEPLDDADRWPWLERIADLIPDWEAKGDVVLACSALKRKYRNVLLRAAKDFQIIYLKIEKEEVIRRLALRKGHHEIIKDYDKIVAAGFRDLEEPQNAIVVAGAGAGALEPGPTVEWLCRSLGVRATD